MEKIEKMEKTNNNSDIEIETLKKIRACKMTKGDSIDPITILKDYHQTKLKNHSDLSNVSECSCAKCAPIWTYMEIQECQNCKKRLK